MAQMQRAHRSTMEPLAAPSVLQLRRRRALQGGAAPPCAQWSCSGADCGLPSRSPGRDLRFRCPCPRCCNPAGDAGRSVFHSRSASGAHAEGGTADSGGKSDSPGALADMLTVCESFRVACCSRVACSSEARVQNACSNQTPHAIGIPSATSC